MHSSAREKVFFKEKGDDIVADQTGKLFSWMYAQLFGPIVLPDTKEQN